MSRNARNPLFDLYCMAYLPAFTISRDGPRKAAGEEEYDMPRPAQRMPPRQLTAAIVAIVAMVAVIGVAQLPL